MNLENYKVFRVPRWLLLGTNGTAWPPNIILISNDMTHRLEKKVIGHEYIHQLQQDETGYFKWLYKYIKFHLEYGYERNPFEQDSVKWENNPDSRPEEYWKLYIK